jgi:cytoskeletal protein CcmA (bactofilin family)
MPVDEERTLTQYLLLSEELEISGSKVSLNGNIHSNKEIKIGGSQVKVNGTKTTSPKVTLPNMADYIPTSSEATITLNGDQKLNDPNYPEGSIVWVKDGKLEISGTITGKVWFLADKGVVIKGDLIPTNEDSNIRIYSKEKVDVGDSGITMNGVFLAEKEITLSGSDLQLTGLFWARELVDISGSDSELPGAVISNNLLKVAGSNFKGTYNSVNQL